MEEPEMEKILEITLQDLGRRWEFSGEDVNGAFDRALRYYRDCGDEEKRARERAHQLVASAIPAARRCGFTLLAMVDYVLFGERHRIQSACKV